MQESCAFERFFANVAAYALLRVISWYLRFGGGVAIA